MSWGRVEAADSIHSDADKQFNRPQQVVCNWADVLSMEKIVSAQANDHALQLVNPWVEM